ncbi:hypothetical protein RCC89_06385 [Cytophagaceae bacterium ABcell3]|nr:hypothetical protein RCC89_06385 [Cytophagaceae bacterium ABcell3]
MFGLFKKKKKELPPFETLKNSDTKDKYFIRLARWDWLDQNMIHVVDNHAPRMITMDPWPQLVFLEANGQRTIHEFVYEMASQYSAKETVPEELDKTILEIIQSLVDDKLIALTNKKQSLAYYLDQPTSQQNKEKAEKAMLEDGFINKSIL